MLNGWFRLIMVALALAIHAIAATASFAQQWPTHPVRFVLPFGPGSGADTAARLITDTLQQKWGQPIVIDGKPGGDGLLSLGTVVSAKDDHTLYFGPSSLFVVQRYLHEDMTFDPETDLAPIAAVAKVQIAVAVPTSLGISTLAEFVALARSKPGELNFGNPGTGSSIDLTAQKLFQVAGIKLTNIGYKGQPPALIDLMTNLMHFEIVSLALALPHIKQGTIKPLAVFTEKRVADLPDVPTIAEAGYPGADDDD